MEYYKGYICVTVDELTDKENGPAVMSMPNYKQMVGDLEKGGITIEVDGKVSMSFGDVPLKELYRVQAQAQEIVNTLK